MRINFQLYLKWNVRRTFTVGLYENSVVLIGVLLAVT
jgi:hypothetical protein